MFHEAILRSFCRGISPAHHSRRHLQKFSVTPLRFADKAPQPFEVTEIQIAEIKKTAREMMRDAGVRRRSGILSEALTAYQWALREWARLDNQALNVRDLRSIGLTARQIVRLHVRLKEPVLETNDVEGGTLDCTA